MKNVCFVGEKKKKIRDEEESKFQTEVSKTQLRKVCLIFLTFNWFIIEYKDENLPEYTQPAMISIELCVCTKPNQKPE